MQSRGNASARQHLLHPCMPCPATTARPGIQDFECTQTMIGAHAYDRVQRQRRGVLTPDGAGGSHSKPTGVDYQSFAKRRHSSGVPFGRQHIIFMRQARAPERERDREHILARKYQHSYIISRAPGSSNIPSGRVVRALSWR